MIPLDAGVVPYDYRITILRYVEIQIDQGPDCGDEVIYLSVQSIVKDKREKWGEHYIRSVNLHHVGHPELPLVS